MSNEVEKWLESLPEKTIEGELDDLRRERHGIDQRIEVREQALAMKRALARESDGGAEGDDRPQPSRIRAMNPPIRGREAIRKVIAATPEKETWTIAEMRRAIVDRGWIANTHAVQVNLSRMYRDGELSKAGTGIYCLPGRRGSLLASGQEAQD
jgi:hypothetical protein